MKKIIRIAMLVCGMVFGLCISRNLLAEPSYNELQQGRYVLSMMNGRAIKNTRIPAIVLDSWRGIIWTCQNLQDGKPLWVKTDLAKLGDKVQEKKKYVVRMLEWQDADLRMPALVLDTEEGITWTCPNIIDGEATWIQKDMKNEQ